MKSSIIIMAQKIGTQLEFKGQWVRESGQLKWCYHRKMYQRLYSRLRRKGVVHVN
jgi:hypothetical protein